MSIKDLLKKRKKENVQDVIAEITGGAKLFSRQILIDELVKRCNLEESEAERVIYFFYPPLD